MKKRSIAAVVLLPFVTLGIYTLYWFVSTKGELNTKGAKIPTAWLLIIPFVNIWWMWKYYEGAEQVTNKKVNGVLMFVLGVFITSLISTALCQDSYNNLSDESLPQEVAVPAEPTATTEGVNSEPAVSMDNSQNSQTQEDSSSVDQNEPIKNI